MRSTRARALALMMSAVVVGSVASPARAQTPRTYEIITGAPVGDTGAFDLHMFPSALTVHPGDTLKFDSPQFGMLALGQTELPFEGFIVPDPDDQGLKVPGAIMFPSPNGVGCGTTAENACVYDGTFLLVDGEQNFTEGVYVRIADSLDGETFTVSNLFHELTVTVDSAAQQSPVNDPNLESHLAQSQAEAEALITQLNTVEYRTTPSGTRIYTAYMGYDTDHLTLFEAFPRNLRLRKGDRIEWHFDTIVEPHTASTPPVRVKKLADRAFNRLFSSPSCDLDGDEGTQPDAAPDLEEPPFCSEGELEFDVPSSIANARGDGKYPNAGRDEDLEHSGIRGGAPGNPRDPYTIKFVRRSGDTPFTMMCAIHWSMKTKITVR